MPTQNPRVMITLTEEEHRRLIEYQHDHKIQSSSKALLSLLKRGLESVDKESDSSALVPVKKIRVPVVGGIAAGEPILTDQEYDTYVEVDDVLDGTVGLRVEGDSMEPTVRYGDLVFIRPQDDVNDGEIAAVIIDDSATLKRVYHITNGLTLISDNAAKYPPMTVTYPSHDCIRIFGKAIAFKRNL